MTVENTNRATPSLEDTQWRVTAITLTSLLLATAAAFYALLLVERKSHILFGTSPFQVSEALPLWQKPLFALLFVAQILVLTVTATALLRWLARGLIQKNVWIARLVAVVAPGVYFIVATAQFGVLRYFRDGIDFALMRSLGGGDAKDALTYGWQELAKIVVLFVAILVLVVVVGWTIKRFGKSTFGWLTRTRPVRLASKPRLLLVSNAFFVVLPLVVADIAPTLHESLAYNVAHQIYTFPATYTTDFDLDGWGFLSRPRDFAPFDSCCHPYAVDLPGNGIDENGVGGDLPALLPPRTVQKWDGSRLAARNVLLLIIDSLRHDLLDDEVEGKPVMPILKGLRGHQIAMYSNAGLTVASLTSMFNGTIGQEPGISLIDRFNELGYRTGVFSAQHEDFGGIAGVTGMRRARFFIHGPDFPRGLRMHSNTSPAALAIPAPLVTGRFLEWLAESTRKTPFFAYLNWQELHFPYHYDRAPIPLLIDPIPRSRIVPNNRAWLRATYYNSARSLDNVIGQIIDRLEQIGERENTVILVLGDHGEELFDSGYLGHGVNLSYEQNATTCKIINSVSVWQAPRQPFSLADLGNLIHNALVVEPQYALPMDQESLYYVGEIEIPLQIGRFTADGLRKFNFRTTEWLHQSNPGSRITSAFPDMHLVHLWESYAYRKHRAQLTASLRPSP
jgi:hypothetical protein